MLFFLPVDGSAEAQFDWRSTNDSDRDRAIELGETANRRVRHKGSRTQAWKCWKRLETCSYILNSGLKVPEKVRNL